MCGKMAAKSLQGHVMLWEGKWWKFCWCHSEKYSYTDAVGAYMYVILWVKTCLKCRTGTWWDPGVEILGRWKLSVTISWNPWTEICGCKSIEIARVKDTTDALHSGPLKLKNIIQKEMWEVHTKKVIKIINNSRKKQNKLRIYKMVRITEPRAAGEIINILFINKCTFKYINPYMVSWLSTKVPKENE